MDLLDHFCTRSYASGSSRYFGRTDTKIHTVALYSLINSKVHHVILYYDSCSIVGLKIKILVLEFSRFLENKLTCVFDDIVDSSEA